MTRIDVELDHEDGITRRTFLKASITAGGGLVLGFLLPAQKRWAHAASAAPESFAPNAFIRIGSDDRVTLIVHKAEMGQGVYTTMPMLLAEELEVELDRVLLEPAPADDTLYSDPLLGAQITGGSTAARGAWEPLRRAGAVARTMLVTAAAQTWQVDASSCRAERGAVHHVPTGRTLSYGALADAAARLPVPEFVALKDPKDWKLIRTRAKRTNTPGKLNGRARFGIDVMVPGMRIATVAACPVLGGKLAGVDDTRAKAIRGVRQVVRLEGAVAVVGDHMWAALQGLRALDIRWDEGPNAALGSADLVAQLEAASRKPGVVARQRGDVASAMSGAIASPRWTITTRLESFSPRMARKRVGISVATSMPVKPPPATTTFPRAGEAGRSARRWRWRSSATASSSVSTLKPYSASPGTSGRNRRLPAARTKRS